MSQTNQKINQVAWASKLIIYLLEFTDPLWKFRNGVKYGHNLTESHKKQLEGLKQEISRAYSQYTEDPFIISHHQSSLFNKPLKEIILMDLDYLQSWLRTFNEAVFTQQEFHRRQAETAKTFFIPCSQQRNPTPAPSLPQEPLAITNNPSPTHEDESADSSYNPRSILSFTSESLCSYGSDDFLTGLSFSAEEISSLEVSWAYDDNSSADSVFDPVFS
jgi:hypothetical protein